MSKYGEHELKLRDARQAEEREWMLVILTAKSRVKKIKNTEGKTYNLRGSLYPSSI